MMPRDLYRFVQILLAYRSSRGRYIVFAEWPPNVASGKRACSHLAESRLIARSSSSRLRAQLPLNTPPIDRSIA